MGCRATKIAGTLCGGAMPELPKPKRVNICNAREYIRKLCQLNFNRDVNPSFFDALCNGELYFWGELNIPKPNRREAIKRIKRIPKTFWKDWGYDAFENRLLDGSIVKLPNSDRYNDSYYSNLLIETVLIDNWLESENTSLPSVTAVPKKAYVGRLEKAKLAGIEYSREEDRAWARDNLYSVDSVDNARKNYAPGDWQKRGRRPAIKSRQETAN